MSTNYQTNRKYSEEDTLLNELSRTLSKIFNGRFNPIERNIEQIFGELKDLRYLKTDLSEIKKQYAEIIRINNELMGVINKQSALIAKFTKNPLTSGNLNEKRGEAFYDIINVKFPSIMKKIESIIDNYIVDDMEDEQIDRMIGLLSVAVLQSASNNIDIQQIDEFKSFTANSKLNNEDFNAILLSVKEVKSDVLQKIKNVENKISKIDIEPIVPKENEDFNLNEHNVARSCKTEESTEINFCVRPGLKITYHNQLSDENYVEILKAEVWKK